MPANITAPNTPRAMARIAPPLPSSTLPADSARRDDRRDRRQRAATAISHARTPSSSRRLVGLDP